MRRLASAAVACVAVALLAPPCAAQSCRHWAEALARSFFPRQVDEQALRKVANLSPQEYLQVAAQIEEESVAEFAQSLPFQQKSALSYNAEVRLRPALERFYQAGAQLYGVNLPAENFTVVPRMDINAFATGSRIFMNEGLIHYFLRPTDYVGSVIAAQTGGRLTPEQYRWLQANFGWQDDWNSIYFVLAHEAAHNLMRHRDERILGSVQKMFNDYRQAVLDHRKDVAHGRKGGGVKRYLWHSLQNFLEQFQTSEQVRTQEAEADAVALLLLQRSGFSPAIGFVAGQRMAMLVGGGVAGGWQGAMTEVLCSTHPDWMLRIQKTQTQLNCVQFMGRLCENHITYPVETVLPQLHEGMSQLDAYHEETARIAEADPASGQVFHVQIEVDPKDAKLQVDNQPVTRGKIMLSVGPHTLDATKEGYSPEQLRIVVYPDVHPKVKLKLKRLRR
jgi:hypothetical protein